VKGSRIVYSCVAPAGNNHASPAFKFNVCPSRVVDWMEHVSDKQYGA